MRVVPDLVLPCGGLVRLVADRRRPRLFLHAWATASGLPGFIASIGEDLVVRPIVVSNRLGTAFAYAPDVDQLFVTELGPPGDPTLTVTIYRAATGKRVGAFPVPEALNTSGAQLQVTRDGRRVFLWTSWGTLLPFEQEIRVYDVESGRQQAASRPVNPGGVTGYGEFVVDEARNLLLTPHSSADPGSHVIAFDATTLAFLGSSGGYSRVGATFQPLPGRGDAAAYILAGGGAAVGDCRVWVDAFDATGALRTRADLPQSADSFCRGAGVILSPPDAPAGLTASVTGRHVTLTWTDPGDTSEFELEAGGAPGRRDLAVRVGRATSYAVPGVPPGTYYVRVRAINEIGASPPSNEVHVIVQ